MTHSQRILIPFRRLIGVSALAYVAAMSSRRQPLPKTLRVAILIATAVAVSAVGLAGCVHGQFDIGAYTHAASRTTFPNAIGEFVRVSHFEYDKSGNDISVGYNINDFKKLVYATVYVYPQSACDAEVLKRKAEVVAVHPEATLREEHAISVVHNGKQIAGHVVTWNMRDRIGEVWFKVDLTTQLDIFCDVDTAWTVAYRFTWRRDQDTAARIAAFTKDSLALIGASSPVGALSR